MTRPRELPPDTFGLPAAPRSSPSWTGTTRCPPSTRQVPGRPAVPEPARVRPGPSGATDRGARGLLRSFGLDGTEIPPDQDDRARLYRILTADRRILILLDNALDVDQIRDLLPGAPNCFVLVTSRDSLGGLTVRHGGHLIEVPPLSRREAQELLWVHLGDRAAEAPTAAAALADQCARLPLALRIAAHRLDLLDSGEPHSSARVVFSWSYRQLPEDVARLFRLLGVLPGRDIDLHGLAALADLDRHTTRHAVAVLVRVHLVVEIAPDRFAMHDLLRMYAKQQADDEDQPDVRDAALTRLRDYYLDATVHATAKFTPWVLYQPKLPTWTADLPAVDSREAAVAWLDAENRGVHKALEFQQRALTIFQEVGDPLREAAVRSNLGVTCSRLGRHGEALDHQQHALTIVRAIGDRQHEAETLNDTGTTLRLAGSPRQAIERHRQALAHAAAIGDRYDEAGAHEGIAQSHLALGDLDEARTHWRAALNLHTELGTAHVERIAATLRQLDQPG